MGKSPANCTTLWQRWLSEGGGIVLVDEKLLGNLDFIKRDEEELLQKMTGGHCGSCQDFSILHRSLLGIHR